MILKELDPFLGGSEEELAIRIAADRMAYYLRRFYRRSNEVDLLHGLRVRSGRSMAHIDHLLIHAWGLLVLEREEVAGRVQIDDDGQWTRHNGGEPLAMGAPITRAYVQALLMKSFLDRRVRQKGFFDRLELDVLVVVSDDCEIEWPQTGRLAEVCNREQVHDRVSQRLAECQHASTGPGPLSLSDRRVLGKFLRVSHSPQQEMPP